MSKSTTISSTASLTFPDKDTWLDPSSSTTASLSANFSLILQSSMPDPFSSRTPEEPPTPTISLQEQKDWREDQMEQLKQRLYIMEVQKLSDLEKQLERVKSEQQGELERRKKKIQMLEKKRVTTSKTLDTREKEISKITKNIPQFNEKCEYYRQRLAESERKSQLFELEVLQNQNRLANTNDDDLHSQIQSLQFQNSQIESANLKKIKKSQNYYVISPRYQSNFPN
ncbi:hypothetical protein GEMRC1_002501 [Eukaryota sp. GEM-RC1]